MHNDMHLSSCGDGGQSLQSCSTLCTPMDRSLPDFFVYWVFPAGILKWVAMPSSRVSSQPRDRTHVSCTAGRFFTAEPLGKPFHIIASYKIFSLPQHTLCPIFPCHLLQCQINSDPFTVSIVLPFLESHRVGIIQY